MQTELRLFGLDLAPLWHECRGVWSDLLRRLLHDGANPAHWRARLLLPDGQQVGWAGGQWQVEVPAGARITALLMPDAQVLERPMPLAQLSLAEQEAAASLEVVASSPFGSAGTVWAIEPQGQCLLMASREHALTALRRLGLDPEHTEVWARSSAGGMGVLQGFGERQRERRGQRRAGLRLLLLLAALLLLAGMALTPTAQLRLTAIEAVHSLDGLAAQAAPALAAREALVQADALAQRIQAQQQQAVPVLSVLQALTQAIPDDSVLQSVQMQGTTVRLAGQSPNAADLMQRLSEVPGFANVRAPSPATRPPGATRESFVIELDRLVQASATPAEVRP